MTVNPEAKSNIKDMGKFKEQELKLLEFKSEEEALQALESKPGSIDVLMAYAMFLSKNDEFEKATEQINRALELDPKFAHARYELGNVKVLMGEAKEAAESYRKAIESDPHFDLPYLSLAELVKGQNPAEAVSLLKEYLENTDQDPQKIESIRRQIANLEKIIKSPK